MEETAHHWTNPDFLATTTTTTMTATTTTKNRESVSEKTAHRINPDFPSPKIFRLAARPLGHKM